AGADVGVSTIHIGTGASLHYLAVRAGRAQEPHHHAHADETIVVVEGSGAILTGGARVPIAAGQCAYVPRGVGHSIEADKGEPEPRALLVYSPTFQNGDVVKGEGPEKAKVVAFDLDALTKEPLAESGPGIVKREIARGPSASLHVIRTRERIPLHVHE